MVDCRMLGIEEPNLPNGFIQASRCGDTGSSIYVSLGISLLESIARLKSNPDLCMATWTSLINNARDAAEYSTDPRKLYHFSHVLNTIQGENYSISQYLGWIKSLSTDSEWVFGIQSAIRSYMCLAVRENPQDVSIIQNNGIQWANIYSYCLLYTSDAADE